MERTCQACTAVFPGDLASCPHCGREAPAERGAVLPSIEVVCETDGCVSAGTVRRVYLQAPAPGLVIVPAVLCAGCSYAPRTVRSWPMKENNDMAKITAHGGPTNAADEQPAEPVPADPVPASGDELPAPASGPDPGAAPEPYDPGAHTVADVQAYLDGAGAEEAERVLGAEAAGKARKSILDARDAVLERERANDAGRTHAGDVAEATVTRADGTAG